MHMARAKHVGRRPATINPLNEDPAGAGEARPLEPPPGPPAVSLTAGQLTYTQNFDTLASSGATGTSLPADWTFSETGGAAPATYSVGTGSGTTGDTWSFGLAGTNPVTDRAFGSLASTTVTQILIGASFANMSGAAITSILISYVGEQWRRGGNTIADRLDFQISFNATSLTSGSWTDVNGLDFVSINASASPLTLDGNATANRLAISFNIAGLSIANGGTFWIRWIDTNIAGNDDGLAVDNFSLTATVNRPPTVAAGVPDHHGNEDQAILYTVPANAFSDPDGNSLTYAASRADNGPLPSWLIFTAATRSFSGTPPADFNGTLSIRVTASDGTFSVSDTFDLIIDPVNDAAIIGGTDSGAVTEDGGPTASGQLTISDADAGEGSFQPVAAGTAGANGHGTFALLADGSWTYTLDNGDPDVQALHAVDTLADTLIVLAADGTAHLLSVAIHGANEASAAPYARVGDEALVNSSVAGLQSQPSVAFLAGGRYVIVFQVFDGDQLDVRARIFNRDGSPAAPDFSVNITASGEQHLPRVAALSDGGFVIVWQDSAGGSYDIIGRLYAADGSAGGEVQIATTLANETAPAVAGLAGGGFAALWIDDSDADGDGRARVFLADGSPAGDAFAVNEPAAGGQVHAAVAVLAGGAIVAVWEDGAAGDVRMRLFSASGTPLTAELTANGGAAGSQGAPCVAALAGGGYAVAWMDGGGDGDGYGIYARLFEADGDPAGAEFRVNTLAAGDQMFPSIAALPDGGFVVSWADGAGPDADDIRAQRFDAGGVPVDAELVVNGHAGGAQSQPAMAANMYGTLVVAWNDASGPGAGGDDDGAAVHVLLTPGGAPPAGPTAAIIGGEDMGAVTEDSAPGTSGTLTVTDPDAGEARLAAQTDAIGSSGYGLFRIDADGSWTYSIAGSALADTIAGGETRSDSITVSSIDGTTHAISITIHGTNDAPMVRATPGTTAYFESVDSAPGSIAVDDALTLADVDDAFLAGATVSIGSNFQAGEDILAFGNDNAAVFGNIAAVYDAGSGVLRLASAGGTATLAQWQAALRAVIYSNGSQEPSQATRAISFTVDDGDTVSAAATRLLGVAARNDSPSGANSTVTIDEDALFTFTAAHFGFTDADGDAFAGVRFGAAPAGGTLYFDAVAVTGFPTTLYSAADIAAGKLTFVPNLNLNGMGAASVGFTVVDNGGTDGAGQDADTTPNTLTFDIVSVNDQPSGADKVIEIDEDSPYTLTLTDFGYSDVDGNAFEGVIFSHPVGGGTLYVDGNPMTSETMVYVATIDAGGVVFVPAANATGALGGIAFRVRDGGGQAADASPNVLSFIAAARNDAPVNTVPGAQAVDEGGTLVFGTASGNALSVADVDSATLTVTLSVAHGTLTLASTAGLSFSDAEGDATMTFTGTAAAIDAALGAGLTYAPAADYYGGDTLCVTTSDDGPLTDADLVAITINPVNDAPSGTSATIALDEDGTWTLTQADFGFGDPVEGDGFAGVVIATLPASGTLLLNGAALLVAETFVTAAQLAAGQLVFQPDANQNGAAYATLAFQVRDDGGTADDGQDTDQSPNTLTFDVDPVNDAPSGTDNIVTGGEDDPYVFTALDFGFSDPVEGNAFFAVQIGTLPADGDILLNGVAVVAGDFIAVSAIDAGMLTFQPDPDTFASPYATFQFRVQDDGGVLNGGVDTDPVANVMTINVTPDNDPPVAVDDALFATEDVPVTYASGQIVDNDTDVEGDTRTIATVSGAAGGTAMLNPDGSVTFTPAPDFDGVAGFDYVVSDGNGGTDTGHVTIDVAAVDDPPTAVDDTIAALEGALTSGSALLAGDWDPDSPLSIFMVEGSAANVGQVITLASGSELRVLSDGSWDYRAIGSAFAATPDFFFSGASNLYSYDSFTYTLAGGGTATVTVRIRGIDSADILLGTAGADVLTGGVGADYLDGGGGGVDVLQGGADNDTIIVDADDQVVEASGGGYDNVAAKASYVLGAGQEVEVLSTTDHDGNAAIDLTGNELGQVLIGNNGINRLDGGSGGADQLVGLGGNDIFVVDSDDRVYEAIGGGHDRLEARASFALAAGQEVEELAAANAAGTDTLGLRGNEFNQTLTGNAGANYLDGGGGTDTLVGLGGNDTYIVDADDQVVEASGGGYDNVAAKASYVLGAGREVEILSTSDHMGTAAIDLTGNEFGQVLIGNAGANHLDGGGGADQLVGLGGNDIFVVDSGDRVYEALAGGFDRLEAGSSFILGAGQEVEELATANAAGTDAIALGGNEFGQVLVGNAGNNYLDGGGGADILDGLGGNDTIIVGADDRVVEALGGGFDNVAAKTGYILNAGAEIEVLSTSDHGGTDAIDLTGNDLSQVVIGNAGANILDGGLGDDLLQGLGGADTFAFTTAPGAGNADTILDFLSGTDKIALDDAVFTGLTPGPLPAGAFVTGTAALDADDRIIYDSATGALYFDADGVGGVAMVQFATLTGLPVLVAGDFTVI
jgi:VCBS repeat-containing protein